MSTPAPENSLPVTPEEIREQMARVLANPRFAAAGRQRRFLEFTVGKVLAGEQDEIKEYLIALEVYDRKPDYDPKVDSIVRVEASRVRTRLREYYHNEGSRDPVIVELPKGSYVPLFRRPEPALPELGPEPEIQSSVPALQEIRVSPTLVLPRAATSAIEPSPVPSAPTARRWWWAGAVAVVVAIATAVGAFRSAPLAVPGRQTVLIPPFTNLSHRAEAERLASGLAKEIESELTQAAKLRVIGHGREPKAVSDYVLEGTVREDESGARVLVQLLSSHDGGYVWSQSFQNNQPIEDLAHAIAGQVELQAAQNVQERSAAGTPRARALEFYRKGRGTPSIDTDGFMLRGTTTIERLDLSQLNHSISLLEQAVSADPNFAAAHSSLSSYYQVASEYDPRMIAKARESARRAIALEPRMGEAHANLAYIHFLSDWNLPEAAEEFRLALEYEPRILTSYRLGADVLTILGRHDEAIRVLENARRLYPNHPVVETSIAVTQFNAGRLAQAEQTARINLTRFPDFHLSHWVLGMTLGQLGRYGEALAEMQQCLNRSPDDARCTAALGYIHAKAGHRKEAEAVLAKYRSRTESQSKARYVQAMIHNALGETDQTYAELEAALAGREFDLPYLPSEPRFANLHGQPRFQEILKKAGLSF
ncbi:MAG: tetratricopeptide repeat protein [Paludibaculum sp.]